MLISIEFTQFSELIWKLTSQKSYSLFLFTGLFAIAKFVGNFP